MVLKIDALLSVKRSSYPDDVQYDFVHIMIIKSFLFIVK